MLSKSFKAGKCKTSLKLATARIKLLRNKREVQVKSMRRELAQLLESGQEQTARIRVEHVIREEKTMAAYDLIELYCELITARLPIIESQKACPIDLKEAISSVIFASPRCADIPELIDIRKHLSAKYGKEFVNSVLEVRPDCGVSRLVVEKLSARAPDVDVETKIKILTSIAQEYKVKWDSKPFEEQLQKPNDDLLNGPSTFASSNKVPKESSSVNYPPAADHTKESITSKNAASKLTSVGSSSYTNSRTSSTSEPFRSQPESRAPERNTSGGGDENSYSREENVSSIRSTWNVEFKDAASAAQAAAESAERASMAARAAAEFATRENMSRQNSSGSNEPSTYSMKNERPDDMSRASKLKGEDVEDSLPKAYGETRKSQGMKPEIQNFQREVTQGVFQREAGETVDDYSRAQKEPSHFSSHSSQINVDDGFLNISSNVTSVKDYDHSLKMPSASESMEHNHNNVKHEDSEYGLEHAVNYGESDFFPHASNFDDESSRYPRYGNSVVFDDYGSDADDIDVFGSNRVKSLFSNQREESSVHQSTEDHASPKQHTTWSPSRNKNPKLHLFTESERYQEKITPVSLSSQSDENVPTTFDDSDGLGSESEEEKDDFTNKNSLRPRKVLHNERSSRRDLFHEESGRGLNNTFFDERKDVASICNKSASSRNSGGDNEEHEAKPYATDIFWKKSGSSSSLDNQSSPRIDKAPSNSYDSSSDEDAQPLYSSNVRSKRKSGINEQLASLPLSINDQEILDKSSNESEQGLNYGRLTGGFKHRGFPRPPYVRNSAVDDSYTSKQNTGETYSISKKPTVTKVEKLSAGMKVLDQELVDQELLPKAKVHISRISEDSIDSHSMLYDDSVGTTVHKKSSSRPITSADSDDRRAKLDSDFTSENKANVDVKLSRRTRGMPPEAKNSALRFSGRPNVESKSSHTNSIASGSHTAAVHDVVNIHGKDNSKTSQQNLPTEQPTLAPKQKSSAREESPKLSQPSSTERVVPANNEKTKSPHSSGGSSSRENSLKNPAHTHPKLPDYDSLAAHFQSLRSNRN